MNDQDFSNYQRILASYPPLSFTLLGFHITITIAGIAGFFPITQSALTATQKMWCMSALATLAFFVTLMLWLMWTRERALKKQAIEDLEIAGIQFPSTPSWAGIVTKMHHSFYFFGIAFWVAVAAYPDWFLNKIGS